jgi:hypothetical protein
VILSTILSALVGSTQLASAACLPLKLAGMRPFRFVVSMTSVSPSQRPRESPRYVRAGSEVRTIVQRNHASLVDHLGHDRDYTGRLDDAETISIDARHHRAHDAQRDAPVVQRQVRRRIEGAVSVRADRCASRLGTRHERRNAAIGRVDNERRLAERPIQPGAVDAHRAHRVFALLPRAGVPLLLFGELLVGQFGFRAQLHGTLNWDTARGISRPDGLQIGIAPGSALDRPVRLRRQRHPCEQQGKQTVGDCDRINAHADSPFVSHPHRTGRQCTTANGDERHSPSQRLARETPCRRHRGHPVRP